MAWQWIREKDRFSILKRIHSRIRYLGEKREFGEHKGSNQIIWERVSTRPRRQEQEKGTFKREELSGRFMTKRLFGWLDKRYDKEY